MVVRGYLSPDELERPGGKKKNAELANRPHFINFTDGGEKIKSVELPNSSQGYSFINNLLGNMKTKSLN